MAKSVDLVGKKYGKLFVVSKSEKRDSSGSIMWKCSCDCGREKLVSTSDLKKGTVKSCGCARNKFQNLVGMKFGRLTVLSLSEKSETAHTFYWKCLCDCGKETLVLGTSLKSGNTVSCGCYSSEQKSIRSKTHGTGNEDRLYRIWSGMKSRCYSVSDHNFCRYGARGIFVDDAWRNDFTEFRKWAIKNGYQHDLSIERIDNDGPYSPDNCRWATKSEQNNNRRSSVYITYNGETFTISEWSKKTGIRPATLARRKRCGWSDNDCIEIPVSQKNNQATRKSFPR